jgi:transcriptional regulator with XRE-family HTH domain
LIFLLSLITQEHNNMKTTTNPKQDTKRFASVSALVKATLEDKGQAEAICQKIAGAQIVNAMIRTRAAAGMTQADVAQKMSCTQSAVSKLEHSSDADLTLQDIASYLRATGGRLNIGVGKQPSRVERIKELATGLKHELEALADLSSKSDDPSIRQSINGFFGEAWFKLFSILCTTTSKLPKEDENESPITLLDAETMSMIANESPSTVMA